MLYTITVSRHYSVLQYYSNAIMIRIVLVVVVVDCNIRNISRTIIVVVVGGSSSSRGAEGGWRGWKDWGLGRGPAWNPWTILAPVLVLILILQGFRC